ELHPQRHKLAGEINVALELSVRGPPLDDNVLAVDPAELTELLEESSQIRAHRPWPFELRPGRIGEDEADPWRSPARRLRSGPSRCREKTGRQHRGEGTAGRPCRHDVDSVPHVATSTAGLSRCSNSSRPAPDLRSPRGTSSRTPRPPS